MQETFEAYEIIINYLYNINCYYLDFINRLSKTSPDNLILDLEKISIQINLSHQKLINFIPKSNLIITNQENTFRERLIYKYIFSELYNKPIYCKKDLYNLIGQVEQNTINFFEYHFKTLKYINLKKVVDIVILEKNNTIKNLKNIISA